MIFAATPLFVSEILVRTLGAIVAGGSALLIAALLARKSRFYQAQLEETVARQLPLDGLRGLMAWCVFVHHTDIARQWLKSGTWACDSELVLFAGKGAVLVFFMITGFLFWSKAVAAKGRLSPVSLWLSRLRRLAPLYLLSAVIIFILASNALQAASSPVRWSFLGRLFGLGILDWSRLPGYKLILANGGVQWSLWYEWRFYALLPVAACFACGRRIYILIGLGVLLASFVDLRSDSIFYWLAFLPGVLSVYLVSNVRIRQLLCARTSALVAATWCLSVLAVSRFGGYFWDLIALTPFFCTVAAGNSYFGFLIRPAARLLGTISYSVYLLHGLILLGILKALGNMVSLSNLPWPLYCCLVAGIATSVVLICATTYRWVEHPFLIWRTPWERAKTAPGSRIINAPRPRLVQS